jgi:hypothetical protein
MNHEAEIARLQAELSAEKKRSAAYREVAIDERARPVRTIY